MQPALWHTSGLMVGVDGNCFTQTFSGCPREHIEVDVLLEIVRRGTKCIFGAQRLTEY